MTLAARASQVPKEMWVPLENKASLDHRGPRASGATQEWQDPRERWVLMGIKAWWALLVLLDHRVRKVQRGPQADPGRRVTRAAKA